MRIRSIAAIGAVKLEESSVGVLPNLFGEDMTVVPWATTNQIHQSISAASA
jgi:hypothetical protein